MAARNQRRNFTLCWVGRRACRRRVESNCPAWATAAKGWKKAVFTVWFSSAKDIE
jgi:hypothetical protein